MARKCKMNVSLDVKKVVFELLSYCNLNCLYCLYHEKIHFKASLSLDQIYQKIDKFHGNGIDKLVLTGGEPTLHHNFLDIAKYAISRIPKVSVCTNGVIIHEKLEQQIVDLEFSAYTVSVDSCIAITHDKIRGQLGAFRQMVSFLEKLKDKNRHISLHITLHADNVNHIHETVEFCRKFSNDIVISTIYYENSEVSLIADREQYTKKADEVLLAYENSDDIALVGFGMSCAEEDCPDKKCVFMVNQYGEIVDCYWKNFKQA